MKKCVKDMNRHLSKDYTCVANKYMKKSSSSLFITEMKIKTTMRCQLKWRSLKRQETTDGGEDVEK